MRNRNIPFILCVWLCMHVGVCFVAFILLSQLCWHNRCASLPPQHSPTKQTVSCTKPCYMFTSFWFLLLLLSFQSDNWAKRARTNDFLRNFKFNHILTIQSPDCLNVYNCTLHLHVSQFFWFHFNFKLNRSWWCNWDTFQWAMEEVISIGSATVVQYLSFFRWNETF